MLPQTTQATKTEVEGDTTVSFTGTMADGTPLDQAATEDQFDQSNQTVDLGAEEAPAEEAQAETDESNTEVSEKAPRSERRQEKLINALKSRTDEVSELRKQLGQVSIPAQPVQQNLPPWLQPQGLPYGEEVTPEQLNARVLETADTLVNAKLSAYQSKVDQLNSYKDDLNYVEDLGEGVFKKGSPNYDPNKDKKLAQLYQKLSQADPSTRLKDLADDLMDFHQAGQQIGKEEFKNSVIKREAEAAVTPTPNGSLPEKQDWDSMNLKQKEAWMKENGVWDK